jgi:eukaryotic-like serine/threonine-protein kinase
MAALDRERWLAVSPHLDRALEMDGTERGAWLDALDRDDPTLAADLRTLLGERDALSREGFLDGPPPAALHTAVPAGQTMGAYTLVSPIGQGGMGTVWLARRSDGRFEAFAAIKLLNAELVGGAGAERFAREGAILARLVHPHIAHLIDAGVTPAGGPYLVLEHVRGERIDVHCDTRGLGVEARVRLFLDVLGAVAHAHANLIVHRDIKPSNVLVSTDGRVKLLDFGIAKLLESGALAGEATALTREGGRALTPEYAAPEQVTGEPITTATDVHALGALLFLLLSGRHWAGEALRSPAGLLKAIVETEPPRLTSAVAGTPREGLRRVLRGDLETIVARALKKDPRERYASVTAFADDLQRWLRHEPIGARPDTLTYRAARFVRRNRAAVVAAGAAVFALVAGTAVATWQMVDARRQRDEARYQARRAEASSELMSLMLEELGPGGKPVTMDALLDRGVELLESRYRADPHFVGLMMVQMARRYMDIEQPDKQRETLARAVAIAQANDDPEVMASAQCTIVRAAYNGGDTAAAEAAFAEGRRALTRLAKPSVQARVDCLRAESEIRQAEAKPDAAIERLDEARTLLEQTGARGLLYTSTLNDLGGIYYVTGRARESLDINGKLLEVFDRDGRGGTVGKANLLHNRAVVLYALGEIVASEAQARVARERVQNAPEVEATSFLLTHGRALARLGRNDEAIALLRRAVERSDALRTAQTGPRIRVELAQALVGARRFDEVEPALSAAERAWKRTAAANSGHLLAARLVRADMALARDQPQVAADWLDERRLQEERLAPKTPVHKLRWSGAAARAALARGDVTRADTLAAEAVRLAENVARDPSASADVGEALLLRARAQRALGRTAQARLLLERALPALVTGLGAEHSLTRQARDLLSSSTPGI